MTRIRLAELALAVTHNGGNFYWSFGEFKSVINASEAKKTMVKINRKAVSIIHSLEF